MRRLSDLNVLAAGLRKLATSRALQDAAKDAIRDFCALEWQKEGYYGTGGAFRRWKPKKKNPHNWNEMVYTAKGVNDILSGRAFRYSDTARGKAVDVFLDDYMEEMNTTGHPDWNVVPRPFLPSALHGMSWSKLNELVTANINDRIEAIFSFQLFTWRRPGQSWQRSYLPDPEVRRS